MFTLLFALRTASLDHARNACVFCYIFLNVAGHRPHGDGALESRTWAWTLWEASLPIPKGKTKIELVCKAIDASYNCQPERPDPIWNIRGVLSNSWHRIGLKVEDEE